MMSAFELPNLQSLDGCFFEDLNLSIYFPFDNSPLVAGVIKISGEMQGPQEGNSLSHLD